jgi:rare lipoprotein A
MTAIATHKALSIRASTWAGIAVALTFGISGAKPTQPAAATTMPATGAKASVSSPAPAAKTTRHWYQLGHASWYGKYFQGQPTASGESYNMYDLTCAHRSLPLGSLIRVTNLRNHKSVIVRVNDRGPVPDDRIVDLSYAAAVSLGVQGVAKVGLELVPAVARMPWAPTGPQQ